MTVSRQTKQEVVDGLLITKQRSSQLEMSLRFRGKAEEADLVKQKARMLNRQIDILLGQLIDQWLVDSEGSVAGIKKANAGIQRSITKIKRDVEAVENAVKALGLIDDAIVIAAKFAAAVV